MAPVAFHDVTVHRCNGCQGLWFDEFDKEALRRVGDAEKLDTGDARIGREFNKVDLIKCPACESQMLRMVDLQQHHIWFEHCTVCGGSFFDAGEFRDLTHQTILDYFRDFLTPAR